jgi:hypothetical protein
MMVRLEDHMEVVNHNRTWIKLPRVGQECQTGCAALWRENLDYSSMGLTNKQTNKTNSVALSPRANYTD